MEASVNLVHGDCLDVLKTMPDNSVDSIVTDPPYGLTSNKKGGSGAASVTLENPYGRARIGTGNGAGGFMGMKWDSDVPSIEIWTECLRVLKPGGHLLAFAGTRTQHRMACRIEDAGFEIRDMIAWVYGSGFPKSHNGEWGGTALKPALEPITMARKPLVGTVAANWAEHGTGALNIDGCRVATNPEFDDPRLGGNGSWSSDKMAKNVYEGGYAGERVSSSALGRWPANLIHDGSDEVLAAFPQSAGQQGNVSGTEPSEKTSGIFGDFVGRVASLARNDGGSAARFFYCAKASKKERNEGVNEKENHHPTVKPIDLMRYLCRLVTPPNGVVLDPFAGSGSTGCAALLEGFKFIGIEREAAYIDIARARIDSAVREGNQPSLL